MSIKKLLAYFPGLQSAMLSMVRDSELNALRRELEIYENLPAPLTAAQATQLDTVERRIIELENVHAFED